MVIVMHSTKTQDNKIIVNYNGDWSGDVRIYSPSGRREMWLPGDELLSGKYLRPSDCAFSEIELRRATALAVYTYMTDKLVSLVEDIDVPGVP